MNTKASYTAAQVNPHYQDLLKARALESLASTKTYVWRTTAAAIGLTALVMALAAVALASCLYPMTSALSALSAMRVGTATGFLLAASSLMLRCVGGPSLRRFFRFVAQALALLLLAFTSVALWYAEFGNIGRLSRIAAALPPEIDWHALGDLHPMAGFGFLLCSFTLLLLDRHGSKQYKTQHYPAEYLAIALIFLSAIPLLGYFYQVTAMTQMIYSTSIPVLSALAFLLFGMSLLMARPRHRLMAIITRHAPGGQMLRRSLPQMLFLLVSLHWLADWGARQDFYDRSILPPVLTLIDGVLVLFIFWRAGGKVDHEYGARLQSAAELAEATALLIAVSDNTSDPIFVKDRQGRLIFANPATLRRLALNWEQAKFCRSQDLLPLKEDAERVDSDDERIMSGGVPETLEQTVQLPDQTVTFQTTKAPWYGPQGQVMGVIGIATDITERKRAEDSLRRRELELERTIAQRTALLRELTNHLETIREEEKRAIARELHDNMGASLTALSMHLEGVYKVLPATEQWQGRQQQMQTLLRSLVATTRRIQTELRPNMLDLFGLKAAMAEQLEDFSERTEIVCKSSFPDEDVAVDHKIEIAVYRMLQEILNNVSKHAHATQVDVILDVDEDRLALTVRDNGVGMSQERFENTTSHGLRGLSERATYLGGKVGFTAAPGKGTTVKIELPLTMLGEIAANTQGH